MHSLLLGLLWTNSLMVCCCVSLFLFFSLLAVAVSVFRFLLLLFFHFSHFCVLSLFLSCFLLRISGASTVAAFCFLALPLVPLFGFLFPGLTWSVCCVLVVPQRSWCSLAVTKHWMRSSSLISNVSFISLPLLIKGVLNIFLRPTKALARILPGLSSQVYHIIIF